MDSYKLKYFIAAAQSLNFSEVARKHYISQPDISHHIALLEEELGVKLFLRIGRRLALTSEGEVFLPEAIRILEVIENAAIDVKRHSQGKFGRLSIVIANTSRQQYVKCLNEFSRKYPDIIVDTSVSLGIEQATMISKGIFDICFVGRNLICDNDDMEYIISHQEGFSLALPISYPDIENTDDLSQLNDYPFICINDESSPLLNKDIINTYTVRRLSPKVIHRYNRMEGVLLSVEAGLGFAILLTSLNSMYATKNVKFVELTGDDIVMNCVIAWQRNTTNRAVLKFVDIVHKLYPGIDVQNGLPSSNGYADLKKTNDPK